MWRNEATRGLLEGMRSHNDRNANADSNVNDRQCHFYGLDLCKESRAFPFATITFVHVDRAHSLSRTY
jgi:erythromycin esterase-like protein